MAGQTNPLMELCDICERSLVFLVNWSILTSFLEADWWHFTNPFTTGFSLPAMTVLFTSVLLSPVPLWFMRLRKLTLHPVLELLLKLTSPILLLLSALPLFETKPWVRTGLLAIGVLILPMTVSWISGSRTNGFTSVCRSTCCKTSYNHTDSPCPLKSSLKSETIPFENCLYKEEVKTTRGFIGVEFSIAILSTMTIRWCTATVNVFYETWQCPLILFALIALFGLCTCVIALCSDKEDSSRRTTTSSTDCSHFHGDEIVSVDHTNNNETMSSNTSHTSVSCIDERKTVSVLEDAVTCESKDDVTICSLGRCSATKLTGTEVSPGECVTARKSILIFAVACIVGISVGANIMLFLTIFNTPNVLCRWSGRDPSTYGIAIYSCFTLGVILSSVPLINLQCNKEKMKERQVNSFCVCSALASAIFLSAAAVLQVQGSRSPFSLVGSCMLCVVLPYCLSDSLYVVVRIAEVSNLATKTCNCLSVLPGIVGHFAATTVLFYFVLLIMFINPQISSFVMGRMNIILYSQVSVISLSLLVSIYVKLSLKTPNEHHDVPLCRNRSSSFNDTAIPSLKKQQRFILVCLLCLVVFFLGVAFHSHSVLVPQQCHGNHKPIHHPLIQKQPHVDDEYSISVMTWNVLLGHNLYGRDNLPCMAAMIDYLEPTVLGLQESGGWLPYWGSKDVLHFITSSVRHGVKGYYGVPPFQASLGVGLVTPLEVMNHQSFILPVSEKSTLPRYSLTKTECTWRNKTIYVFNVHAVYKNWTGTPDNPSPFALISVSHIKFIIEQVKKVDESQPLIVMGDFNLNPDELELKILQDELGLQSALHPDGTLAGSSTLRNRFAVVDHIFYRGLNLTSSRVVEETINVSDHHPVLAYFKMPR